MKFLWKSLRHLSEASATADDGDKEKKEMHWQSLSIQSKAGATVGGKVAKQLLGRGFQYRLLRMGHN